MRTATVTEAKNGLSALLDRVRGGESIVIVDRGVPVARMEPIGAYPDQTGRLRRLERAGLVRVGTATHPLDLLREPPPSLPAGVSAVEVLLEERRTGR
jgi:prevent-host-death family protein